VVRTVSTTAWSTGSPQSTAALIETPVGFNHRRQMLHGDVLIGGKNRAAFLSGPHSEGDGPLMGLLLVEMIASTRRPLGELVEDLLEEVGPVHYQRVDLRLSRPIAKAEMTEMLTRKAPKEIAGQTVREVNDRDGVKYLMADDLGC
jgi:phosphomannomutase